MTYPKITLKPKSWAEDSTIELDYEDAKSIWEQLKAVFDLSYPTQIVSCWDPNFQKMESITKTNTKPERQRW